jgi:hypothetical protein
MEKGNFRVPFFISRVFPGLSCGFLTGNFWIFFFGNFLGGLFGKVGRVRPCTRLHRPWFLAFTVNGG